MTDVEILRAIAEATAAEREACVRLVLAWAESYRTDAQIEAAEVAEALARYLREQVQP